MNCRAISSTLLSITLAAALHASIQSDIGYTELKAEFGSTLPDGSNLSVLQVEAPDSSGNWATKKTGELSTRNITFPLATTTPTTYSTHALYVANYLCGSTTSILPNLGELQVASIGTYRSLSLKVACFASPAVATWDVENLSLSGSVSGFNTNANQLLDYRIIRDKVTIAVALENGTANTMTPLWGNNYNAITVGTATGSHTRGGTNLDGSGRLKPDLVGTATYTSYATPVVASAAGLIIAEAKRTDELAAAKDPRVVKALLMAGATKEEFSTWANSAAQPLDAIYGAGQVNIYNSYKMLLAGQQPAGDFWLENRGWDLGTSGATAVYYFEVPDGQTMEFSTVLTWFRELTTSNYWTFANTTPVDLNLCLYNSNASFALGTVVAQSTSALDNVEHIYYPALPSGKYALAVTGPAGTTYGIAWNGPLSGSTATSGSTTSDTTATDSTSSDSSSTTTSTTVAAPSITTQPASVVTSVGTTASFAVSATGSGLSYQWYKDSGTISGATASSYTISSVTTTSAGSYTVVVSNEGGSVTSSAATLTLNSSTDSSLLQLVPAAYSARGANSTKEGLAMLFDGVSTTKWLDFSGTTWVVVELSTASSLSSYSFTSANDNPVRDPYNWTVEGSNDGSTWTTLDTRSAETFASRYLQRDFVLSQASASYRYFRFSITCMSGSITQLAELQLWNDSSASTSSTVETSTTSSSDTATTASTSDAVIQLVPAAYSARGANGTKEGLAMLFDGVSTTKWLDFSGTTWVVVELSTASSLSSYSFTSANDNPVRDPYNWTVEGSNDGSTWTVVDTQTAETFASRYLQRDFVLSQASASYRYFRFSITCMSGSITQLAELQLWNDSSASTSSTVETSTTSSSDTTTTASTSDAVIQLVPAAYSARGANGTKEGLAMLFDGVSTTKWLDFSGTTWVVVEFATARSLEAYSFTSANDNPVRDPYNWTVEGSNDGSTWTVVDTQTAQTFASRYLLRDFVLSQTSASYRYFRFSITCMSGSITQLAELELWGH